MATSMLQILGLNLTKAKLSGLACQFCQPVQQQISHFQFFFSIGQTF